MQTHRNDSSMSKYICILFISIAHLQPILHYVTHPYGRLMKKSK